MNKFIIGAVLMVAIMAWVRKLPIAIVSIMIHNSSSTCSVYV